MSISFSDASQKRFSATTLLRSVAKRSLLEHYAEPHRAYHNLQHLADCLEQFDSAKNEAILPDEVELALWFHDAIYDPHAKDNEEQSAAWAVRELTDAGAKAESIERVAGLILATKHNAVPPKGDAQLVVDIDLSILGREPIRFDAYDAAIREEYAWVPEEAYREGRSKILANFLAREWIFSTVSFRQRYEAHARENMKRCLQRLKFDPDPSRARSAAE